MAIDAAKDRVTPPTNPGSRMGRGERRGGTSIEDLANLLVEGTLRGEMAGVAKVVVSLETVRCDPARRRADQPRRSQQHKEAQPSTSRKDARNPRPPHARDDRLRCAQLKPCSACQEGPGWSCRS